MGSVIDYIECPNCKQEAFSDFYYKTGEEYINCSNCGYHHSVTYKRNDEGQFVTKDGTDNYSFDNLILEHNELKNPYCAYRIKYHDSNGTQSGSMADESEYLEFVKYVADNDSIIESASISSFVEGNIITETLKQSNGTNI